VVAASRFDPQQVARMSAAICGDKPQPRMSLRSCGLRLLRTLGSPSQQETKIAFLARGVYKTRAKHEYAMSGTTFAVVRVILFAP
jgi:hypothetical protein